MQCFAESGSFINSNKNQTERKKKKIVNDMLPGWVESTGPRSRSVGLCRIQPPPDQYNKPISSAVLRRAAGAEGNGKFRQAIASMYWSFIFVCKGGEHSASIIPRGMLQSINWSHSDRSSTGRGVMAMNAERA